MDFKAHIGRFLRDQRSGEKPLRAVLAFSGGPDSTFLFHHLVALQADLPWLEWTAAHVDHGLRGEESREDAEFCRKTATAAGVPIRVVQLRPPPRPTPAWARRERYHLLETIAREQGAGELLTAHHLDDQIETILLKLLRGVRPARLHGMRAVRALGDEPRLRLLRPLLPFAREEIRSWLRQSGLDSRRDSSNDDPRFRRNRLRTAVIPELDRVAHPGWKTRWVRLFEEISSRARARDRAVEHALLSILLQGAGLQASEERVDRLREDLLCEKRGTLVGTRLGWRIRIEGDRIEVVPPVTLGEGFSSEIAIGGITHCVLGSMICQRITREEAREKVQRLRSRGDRDRAIVEIPSREHAPHLLWRSSVAGDRVRTLGFPHARAVRRAARSRGQDRSRPSVVTFEGRIVWIVGVGIAEEFRLREVDDEAWIFELRFQRGPAGPA